MKEVLKTNKVKYFQLRLKSISTDKIIKISRKIKKICKYFKVKFIVNDNPLISLKVGADGCHLGQSDMDIEEARKIIKKKIIGVTCHNSIKLAKNAFLNGADYIALGSFYKTRTKKVMYKANITTLNKIKKVIKIPVVAVGGINERNYKFLLLNKADFLAISGYIWKNKKLEPLHAIEKLK